MIDIKKNSEMNLSHSRYYIEEMGIFSSLCSTGGLLRKLGKDYIVWVTGWLVFF